MTPLVSALSRHNSFRDIPSLVLERLNSPQSFFASAEWFELLNKTTEQKGRTLELYCTENTQQPSIFPIWRYPRRAPFSSSRLAAVANFYSPLFTPIVARDDIANRNRHSWQPIAEILKNHASNWHSLDLRPLPLEDGSLKKITQICANNKLVAQTYFCFGNWYTRITSRNYQDYYETLPSRLRNTLERKKKQLEKKHHVEFRLFQEITELEQAIVDYEHIYGKSWKPIEAHPNFIADLIRLCAKKGLLRLGIAYIDQKPAAAQIWIIDHNVAAIYKLAYDPQFATYSIGSLLTEKMIRHVIETDGVEEIDYLIGDDTYKKDWMSERRERWGIMILNPGTLLGRILIVRHVWLHQCKSMLRKLITQVRNRS